MLSMVILLLIAFVAWANGLQWLFIGCLFLLIILARSIGITVVIIIGAAALYFLKVKEYWFVVMILLAAAIVLISRKKGAGGAEMYSPELMKLLGG